MKTTLPVLLAAGFLASLFGIQPLVGQTTPPPTANFPAQEDTGWLPPDTHGAVGPNHVITAVNGGVRIQDRGGSILRSSALNTFLNRTDSVFDPKVYYDHFSDRWLMTACANAASPNSAVIAAASKTADPTGDWWVYSFDADASNNVWADYPSAGFNKDWFAIGMNMFQINGGFSTGRLYVLPRAALYAGGTVNASIINDNSFTLVPAVTHDATLSALYVLQTWNGNSGGRGYLRLLNLTGSVNAPQLVELGKPATTQPWSNNTASGGNILPQSGSNSRINAGDDRMQHVVYRNGSIWATHNGYATSGSTLRSFVQWWEISPQATTLQYGRLEDTGGVFHYCFPSIAVNRGNDALIGCSRFSSGTFPSAAYAFRGSGDTANTIRAPHVYKAGEATYFKTDSSGRNRWGDYSATVTDPLDDMSFWTLQEHSATGNKWSTRWARVESAATTSILRFTQSNYTVSEAGGTATLSATRTGNLRSAVTVNYTTSDGSAAAGSDYTPSAGTLTFSDGQDTTSFNVPITNDTTVESDETIQLTLSSPGTGASLGSPVTATITIADNDVPLPVVSVAASDNSASEPSDPAVFTFTRSGSTAVDLTVSYAMSGSATNGTDFSPLDGSVTIPAGSGTATVTLNPVDDTTVESTETATLTLATGTGYAVGSPGSASADLLDNDQAPVVTVQANDPAANESGDSGQFTITRTNGTSSALTVNLSVSGTAAGGSDHTTLPTSINIPAGAASTTVTVSPLDDTLVEGTETIVLSLAAGAGYTIGSPLSATVTLNDNDVALGNDAFAGRTTFTGLNLNGQNTTATKEAGEPAHAGNPGGRSVWWTWTASFSGSVTFSTEGSSFDTLLAVYTGTSPGSLGVVVSDDDSGGNRTSRATFNAVSGTVYQIAVDGYNGASGTIVLSRTPDPAQAAVITLTATDAGATEGSTDTGTFTLSRAGSSTAALSIGLAISGTASNAADYLTVATTFTLPAGAASGTFTVTPVDDAQVEGPETVSLTLQTNPNYTVGTPSAATIIINDNDSTVGNDYFSSAAVMTGTKELGTNSGATKEAAEPNHAGSPGGKSVWWRWTATFSGNVTFHTEGSDFDTLLAVHTGTSVGGLTTVAGDDDSGAGTTSMLSFTATTGTVYQIAVDGKGGASGNITLSRLGDPAPLPLVTVSASDATAKEGSGDVGRFLISRTGATTNSLTVNVSFSGTAINGSDYSLLAASHQIPAGSASVQITVSPVDDALAEGDETATVIIDSGAGYGIEGDAPPYVPGGRATASVTIADNDIATSNDAFADRFAQNGNSFTITGANSSFTKESGEPSHAGNGGGRSAWWSWTAPANGSFTVTTHGSSFDTLLAVYTGSQVSSLSLVASNDDSGSGVTSEVTFAATAGTIYQIVVDGYLGGTGSAAGGSISLSGSSGTTLPPPVLAGPTVANASLGLPFSYTITATNSPTSFNATGLPSGLTVNTNSGVISGTPDAAGEFSVILSATNAAGTGTGTLNLGVTQAAAQVLYQTDFEAFTIGVGTVSDNGGWLGDPTGHGIYEALPGRGRAMFVGFDAAFADDVAFFWHPLNLNPVNNGTPVVRLTAEIAVINSTNGEYDDFAFQFYNKDGEYLASILFDNLTNKIWLDDDSSSSSYTDTGKTFSNGTFAAFEVEVNHATNTWTAWHDGEQLFAPRPYHLGGKTLTLGDVTLLWKIQTSGSPGDNLLVTDNFSVTAEKGGTTTFTSSATTTVPSNGTATPYPSTINVSGMVGQLNRLAVRVQGIAHTFPGDLDLLLVAPDGRAIVLMSDTGGSTEDYTDHTFTFDDLAPTGLLNSNLATHAARYRPTDFSDGGTDLFPAPAPAGAYLTSFSSFHGMIPNGDWNLYVVDDGAGDQGSIAAWSLEIGVDSSLSLNFAGWRSQYFTSGEIAGGLGDPNADPEHDGMDNLLEYALSLHPRRPDTDSPNLPRTTIEPHGGVPCLCFQYLRDLSRSGISYAVQTSSGLSAWSQFTGQDLLVQQVGTVQTRKAYLPLLNASGMIRLAVTEP